MSTTTLGRLLGSGKEAEVYECGELVVKLYRATASKRSAFREAAILAAIEALELPAPTVWGVRQIDERWGVSMARADGRTFSEGLRREPNMAPAYLRQMALLHLRIHNCQATHFACVNARLAANIRQTVMLGEARQKALLEGLAALPEGDRLCHGDFHPMNILGSPGREMVVDWLDASRGDPAADVCRSYVLMKPSYPALASAYLAMYSERSGVGKERILGWLPFVAAARLAEGVPDEADQLMAMADAI
jgi:aminoglycoside phosphotransferase (APT) family kinase protein